MSVWGFDQVPADLLQHFWSLIPAEELEYVTPILCTCKTIRYSFLKFVLQRSHASDSRLAALALEATSKIDASAPIDFWMNIIRIMWPTPQFDGQFVSSAIHGTRMRTAREVFQQCVHSNPDALPPFIFIN